MQLSLSEIELFMAFAEAKNSIEAAKNLAISQPTFGERLKKLESRLPETPFAWQGHKRVLNAYGELLAKELGPHIATLRRAARVVTLRDGSNIVPKFKVSGRTEILARIAQSKEETLKLVLSSCASADALEFLLGGFTDVAITHEKPSQKDLRILKLFNPGLVWICHPSQCPADLLALQSSTAKTNWKSAMQMPWLAYSESDSLLARFAKHANLPTLHEHVSLYCDNWLVICNLVARGRGVAVVPKETLGTIKTNHLHTVELPKFEESLPFYAVYRRELTTLENGKKLIQCLRNAFPS